MFQITLSGWISTETWRVFLAFARVGTAFMMLPGYGEPGVPARSRMIAALGFSIATAGTIGHIPPAPTGGWQLVFGLLPEVFSGALLGLISRITISAVLMAGMFIGMNIGLANIFASGIGFEQSATVGTAINAAMIAAMFASDAHHLILRSLIGSYDVVPPGTWPDITASAHTIMTATSHSFSLAIQLSLPFLMLALLFNVSMALVNKIMPSLPVFNIGQPALVAIGLYLLAASIPNIMDRAVSSYVDVLGMVH